MTPRYFDSGDHRGRKQTKETAFSGINGSFTARQEPVPLYFVARDGIPRVILETRHKIRHIE